MCKYMKRRGIGEVFCQSAIAITKAFINVFTDCYCILTFNLDALIFRMELVAVFGINRLRI